MRRLALLLAVTLLAGAGCADGDEQDTPERGEQTADTRRCTNEQAGYSIAYPADWHTNPGDVAPTCSYFDPQPIELPELPQDVAGLAAISIRPEPVAFSRVTGEDPATRVLQRGELEIAGRPAVRRLTEATGEGLGPQGRRSYQYLLNLDGETLIATAAGGGRDFDANRELLDEMMRTLEL